MKNNTVSTPSVVNFLIFYVLQRDSFKKRTIYKLHVAAWELETLPNIWLLNVTGIFQKMTVNKFCRLVCI